MKISFISRNTSKIKEAEKLLAGSGIEIVPYAHPLNELQTEDTKQLVYDKALKAFSKIGRPLMVEHTSLLIEKINGFPGGLSQIFWDNLQADTFCELFAASKVIAKSLIAYCDAKTVTYFEGAIAGTVANAPKGDRAFQWDCVFVPDGYEKTLAEMGDEKNFISMRKIAFDQLKAKLIA